MMKEIIATIIAMGFIWCAIAIGHQKMYSIQWWFQVVLIVLAVTIIKQTS